MGSGASSSPAYGERRYGIGDGGVESSQARRVNPSEDYYHQKQADKIRKDRLLPISLDNCVTLAKEGEYSTLSKKFLMAETPLPISDIDSLLCNAAGFGHLDVVELLLQARAKTGARKNRPRIGRVGDKQGGKLPLHEAAKMAQSDVVDLLLSLRHFLPHLPDAQGQTALHKACNSSQQDDERQITVATLLHHMDEEDINTKDSRGNTSLHLAAANNNIRICEMLVEKGANNRLRNHRKKSPGQIAIEGNFEELGNALESGLIQYIKKLRRQRSIHKKKKQSKSIRSSVCAGGGGMNMETAMAIWNVFFENAVNNFNCSDNPKKRIDKQQPGQSSYDPRNYTMVMSTTKSSNEVRKLKQNTNVYEYKNEFLLGEVPTASDEDNEGYKYSNDGHRYWRQVFDLTYEKNYFYCAESGESSWLDPVEDDEGWYFSRDDLISTFVVFHDEEYGCDFYTVDGVSYWDIGEILEPFVTVKDYVVRKAHKFKSLPKWQRIFDEEFQLPYFFNDESEESSWVAPEGNCWISRFIIIHDAIEARDFFFFPDSCESTWVLEGGIENGDYWAMQQ